MKRRNEPNDDGNQSKKCRIKNKSILLESDSENEPSVSLKPTPNQNNADKQANKLFSEDLESSDSDKENDKFKPNKVKPNHHQ